MNAHEATVIDMALLSVLYKDAMQIDASLDLTLKSLTGRTRWTLKSTDYDIPEVVTAIRAKYRADEALLSAMRDAREGV